MAEKKLAVTVTVCRLLPLSASHAIDENVQVDSSANFLDSDYEQANVDLTTKDFLQQPFYGPLSGMTRVSQYQKKHSPTHHPDHHSIFISFFDLP